MKKLAILSDTHGNYAALLAVAEDIERWSPDAAVVAGDMVNRGPRSLDCMRFTLERQRRDGWHVLRGNHEDYVIRVAGDPDARPGIEGAIRANIAWVARQIGGDIAELAALPDRVSLRGPDGGEVRVLHASMRHNRDNILVDTPEELLREQIAPPPRVFCCGHTHRPLVRPVDDTLVVNAGSAGLPFDGDTRPSYARLEWRGDRWHASIIRVPYDLGRAERDFFESGFMDESGPVATLILEELRSARPTLFTWSQRYQSAVLAGELSVEDSVRAYLASC